MVVQKLVPLPKGMLVHKCNLNSFEFPVTHAISRGGTPAIRVMLLTRVLVCVSTENSKEWMMPRAKQITKLNRKNPIDILFSVIRRYYRSVEHGKRQLGSYSSYCYEYSYHRLD